MYKEVCYNGGTNLHHQKAKPTLCLKTKVQYESRKATRNLLVSFLKLCLIPFDLSGFGQPDEDLYYTGVCHWGRAF